MTTAWWSAASECIRWIEQTACGLKGHDELRHFLPNRLALHCTRCGHRSTGWEIRAVRADVVSSLGVRSTA